MSTPEQACCRVLRTLLVSSIPCPEGSLCTEVTVTRAASLWSPALKVCTISQIYGVGLEWLWIQHWGQRQSSSLLTCWLWPTLLSYERGYKFTLLWLVDTALSVLWTGMNDPVSSQIHVWIEFLYHGIGGLWQVSPQLMCCLPSLQAIPCYWKGFELGL